MIKNVTILLAMIVLSGCGPSVSHGQWYCSSEMAEVSYDLLVGDSTMKFSGSQGYISLAYDIVGDSIFVSGISSLSDLGRMSAVIVSENEIYFGASNYFVSGLRCLSAN